MNLRTLSALGYRELYLSRKMLLPIMITFVTISLLSVLIILSFDYGNMEQILTDLNIIPTRTPDGQLLPSEIAETSIMPAKEFVVLFSKLCPLLTSGFMITYFLQSCQYDEKNKWKYFYISTPVTPVTKAAVTYSVVIMLNIICFILSLGFCTLMSTISGIALSSADFGIIFTGIALGDLVGVIIHTGIKIFHSLDKAGILVVCIGLVGILIFEAKQGLFNKSEQAKTITDIFSAEKISKIFEKMILPAFIIIIASVAIGFAVNVILYKRREK